MRKCEIPEAVRLALEELKQALGDLYGERLCGVYLYGSYARGDFNDDSDVDVLIVLKGETRPTKEMNCISRIVSHVSLRYDLLVAAYPISRESFEARRTPFLESVRSEGVQL